MATRNQSAGRLVLGLAALATLMLAITSCRPAPPDQEELPPPEFSEACEICLQDATSGDPYGRPLEEDAPFVPNQLALIGLPEDLDRIAEETLQGSERVAAINLGEAVPGLREQREAKPAEGALLPDDLWQQIPDSDIRLYQFPPDADTSVLADTLERVNAYLESNDVRGVVLADLNYVAGAPWTISGGSLTGPAAGLTSNDQFWDQWALGKANGIGLVDETGARMLRPTGGGTSIILFDTSPFTARGRYSFAGWADPVLTLAASAPVPVPQSTRGGAADHGLFAAGLAHAVAPDSELHLVRVLNDDGNGYLFSLLEATTAVLNGRMASNTNSLANTVFNYSLTIPADPATVGAVDPRLVSALERLAQRANLPPSVTNGDFHSSMLEIAFEMISRLGGVAVAAAGNDSDANWIAGQPALPAALPAGFPAVVGVEAGTQEGTVACYSNLALDSGDVRAPGGNGGIAPSDCLAQNAEVTCTDQATTCPYALISYMVKDHRGFGTWVGSSFAAPLVSGAAALQLEAGRPVDFGPVLQFP